MSAISCRAGLALALVLQAGDEQVARVQEPLRAWFAARLAGTSEGLAFDAMRGEVLRRWPRGRRGEEWLRDIEQQRALFDDCFRYGAAPSVLPGGKEVRVQVPRSYDPRRPTPTVVMVWPRFGERGGGNRYGARAELADAIVVEATTRVVQSLAQRGRQTAWRVASDSLARQLLPDAASAHVQRVAVLAAADIDDELVQRGLFSLLGLLQRHYNVDRDRLIVDAAGGACRPVLCAAISAPDRFAGIVLRAPQATQDLAVDNLTGVNVLVLRRPGNSSAVPALQRAFNALQDARCDIRDADAFPAVRLEAWCMSCRRDLMPRRVRLLMRQDGVVDGFWVSDISADLGGTAIEGAAFLDVRVDRRAGRITVETRRIERFSLLLNDTLLDLDRGFVLDVNGLEIAMRRGRSPAFLCDTVLERFDPGFLFTTAISVDIPRRG